jgi:hypothetical protein
MPKTYMLSWMPIAAAAVLGACGASPRDSACGSFVGTHEFRYMGPVIGDGTLTVARDDAGVLTARMTLRDDMGSGATLEIEGPGECTDAGLRVRFGPGDHPRTAYRVTGGAFVVHRDPVAFDWFFGAWSASVVLKESGAVETLRGFVREAPRAGDEGAVQR